MRAWIRAGLISSVIQIVLTIPVVTIYVLPQNLGVVISLCICIPFFLFYPIVGALASHWLTPPRTISQAAVEGSLAGGLAASIDGVATIILSILIALLGLPERYLQQLPPATLDLIRESGLDSMFTVGGQIAYTLCTVPFHVVLGVILGCIGGMIYAAIRKE